MRSVTKQTEEKNIVSVYGIDNNTAKIQFEDVSYKAKEVRTIMSGVFSDKALRVLRDAIDEYLGGK